MLFQEDPVAIANNRKISPPRYIVGTTKLIGCGYTMHKARVQVQFDPEWMDRDHQQAKKQINRIGQTKATMTYQLRCVDSNVERAIYDRQGRRKWLMDLALDPNKMTEEDFKRDHLDEEQVEEDQIDPEDRVPGGVVA